MKKSFNKLTIFSAESSSIQQRSSETSSLNQFSEQGQAVPVLQNKEKFCINALLMVKHQEKKVVLSKYICQFDMNFKLNNVTSQWMKSLFSRWSRMKRNDLLQSISREDTKE